MLSKIKDKIDSVIRWVHRTEANMRFKILTGIGHLLICLGGILLFGLPAGALTLWLAGPAQAVIVVGIISVVFTVFYALREQRNTNEKGFRQAVRDGDTLFGPDFILAVVGSVAGFTIVKALLGIL